jgi:4-amino-4-deoxy-L-arabinose transferase-like glycosyltransferase
MKPEPRGHSWFAQELTGHLRGARMPAGAFPKAASVLVFAVLLISRLGQTRWGLPYLGEIDEKPIVDAVRHIMTTGDYNPHFFNYGSVSVYLSLFSAIAAYLRGMSAGTIGSLGDFTSVSYDTLVLHSPDIVRWPRLLFAALSTATLIPTYAIARKLRDHWAGLGAVLAMAFSQLAAYYAVRINVDALGTLFVAIAAWAALALLEDEQPEKWAALSGLAVGAATGSKYTLALAGVLPVVALLLRKGPVHRWRCGGLAFGAAALVFLVTTPYAFLALPEFLRDAGAEAAHYGVRGHPGFEGTPGWSQLWFHIRFVLSPQGLGMLAGILAVAGMVLTLRARPRPAFVLAGFVALFTLFISGQRVNFVRNLMPIYPVLAAFAGVAISWAGGELARLLGGHLDRRTAELIAVAVTGIVLLTSLNVPLMMRTARYYRDYEPSQQQVVAWLAANVARAEKVGIPRDVPWAANGLANAPFQVITYTLAAPDLGALAAQGVRWMVVPFQNAESANLLSMRSGLAGLSPVASFGDLPLGPGRALDLRLDIAPLSPDARSNLIWVDPRGFGGYNGLQANDRAIFEQVRETQGQLALFWNGEVESTESNLEAGAYQVLAQGYGTPAGPPGDFRQPRMSIIAVCRDGVSAEQLVEVPENPGLLLGPMITLGAGGDRRCRVKLRFADDAAAPGNDRNIMINRIAWARVD